MSAEKERRVYIYIFFFSTYIYVLSRSWLARVNDAAVVFDGKSSERGAGDVKL